MNINKKIREQDCHALTYRVRNDNRQRGFTLLEVMISTAIICVIVLAISSLQMFVLEQEQASMANYLSVDNANRGLEQMVREIRNSRTGANGTYALEIVQDQELVFYCDINSDGKVERIRYFLDQRSLKKGVTKPTDYPVSYPTVNEAVTTVTDYIANGSTPLFYYYNGKWPKDTLTNPVPPTSRLSQTRLIGVKLILNSNQTFEKTNHEVFSYAQIRTLKDNL